jgi:hypothetical protein
MVFAEFKIHWADPGALLALTRTSFLLNWLFSNLIPTTFHCSLSLFQKRWTARHALNCSAIKFNYVHGARFMRYVLLARARCRRRWETLICMTNSLPASNDLVARPRVKHGGLGYLCAPRKCVRGVPRISKHFHFSPAKHSIAAFSHTLWGGGRDSAARIDIIHNQ